jgi:hypothetical protein
MRLKCLSVILGRGVSVILQTEQLRAVFDQILEEVLDVLEEELYAAFVERRVGQHGAQLDKEAQQVCGAVHLGHGLVHVIL